MKKNKYKFKKWVLVPIFLLLCSLVIGLGFVKPTKAFTHGLVHDDVPNDYYSLAPSSITAYLNANITDPSIIEPYLALNFPQRLYPEIAFSSSSPNTPVSASSLATYYLEGFTLDNIMNYDINPLRFSSAYKSIVVSQELYPYLSTETAYICFEYDNLIIPSYKGAVANMYTSFLDWYKNCLLFVEDGAFVWMTCDINYWTYSNDGYAIPSVHSYELTFDSSMDFYFPSSTGSSVLNLYDTFVYIENELSSYNLGQYLLYFSNVKIYGASENVFTTDATEAMFGYYTPYIEKTLHPFFDINVSPIEAYHSYYLTINDYFSNPNIPPLAYTPIEPVDMSTWLLTAVGAFMTAELFPGFAVAGILAVLVAFPLAIWLLKVALGG